MTMNIGEANGINALLCYLAGEDLMGLGVPERTRVVPGLALLLKASDRTLMAGYKPDDAERLLAAIEARLEDDSHSSAYIAAKVEIFQQDGGQWWLLMTGEMFGPFATEDQALDAIPDALRSME